MPLTRTFTLEVVVRQEIRLKAKLFICFISIAGAVALSYSTYRMLIEPVRLDWMLALTFAVLLAWRAEVWIPGIQSKITLTDTFIYLGALIINPWAAAVLASVDGLVKSPRTAQKSLAATAAINMSAMNLSVLAATIAATNLFGPLHQLVTDASKLDNLALALGVIALINYVINTGIAAIAIGLWRGRNILRTWRENYLWTSPAFFVGAIAAGAISKAVVVFGLYSFVIALPILLLTYTTYKTYLGKVEASNRHIEKLAKLHLATIESLTMAIDAKDPNTRGHIQRVRTLAEGLARAAGYPEDQMEGLKAAALLHDIGKLAVPEHILSKPGKLSAAEYSKIMIHPVVGADILSNVDFPYEVVPIVKHHHEKYDGTGYPSGLKGSEIPLGARILSIVDCYDALTTNRPYRPRYTREQALELMRREAGRAFDPVILEKFFEIIDTLETTLPTLVARPVTLFGVEPVATDSLIDYSFGPPPSTRAEKALRDISSAQREALSLYEIAQTLGSTLKLNEVLPIVASKLETIANFTTLVIYLAEGRLLRAAYVIGKNAEALKGIEIPAGEGGIGWVCEHHQALIGGSPLADLERPLGHSAARYNSTAIIPLLHAGELVGGFALYSEENRGYTTDEVRLLETISSHAATAIHNALQFERTQESALTDNLTGLPNSRYMYSFFDQERSRAERHGYPLVLMMMDLDGFKKINDTYGHHVGDEILRRVAQLARTQLRTGDTLIRYAGDEFVAVLHRATPEMVRDLKARLQLAVDSFAHEVRAGRIARVGISIGHATYGQDGFAIDELMEVADERMYEDKFARKRNQSLHRVATFPTKAI
ncbi:MAG TPA: HD domain-containing phosphohydrolase [Blastocatellia bacterium]|nr:HD domain-containing phosphohydrolase [Blastocatellia bacterium]